MKKDNLDAKRDETEATEVEMEKGYLALVLHSHLPYVRHPEHDEFLEEDWLYDAITETYVPLINMFDGLVKDGVDFRITMSLTPTLIAMLTDPLLQHRYVRHITKLIELSEKEIVRTKHQPEFNPIAHMYRDIFVNSRYVFDEKYGRNLVTAFRKFQDLGKLEIITCGATHGLAKAARLLDMNYDSFWYSWKKHDLDAPEKRNGVKLILKEELPDAGISYEELEKALLQKAMEKANNVGARAARLLNMSYRAFAYRCDKYGLNRHPQG